jgi:hypothetical protein
MHEDVFGGEGRFFLDSYRRGNLRVNDTSLHSVDGFPRNDKGQVPCFVEKGVGNSRRSKLTPTNGRSLTKSQSR